MRLGEITITCKPWAIPDGLELRIVVHERGEVHQSRHVVYEDHLTPFFDTIMSMMTAELKSALLRADERERTSQSTAPDTSSTTPELPAELSGTGIVTAGATTTKETPKNARSANRSNKRVGRKRRVKNGDRTVQDDN